MMKYYLEIKFLPDDDISIHFLWSKVYKQLHLALASVKNIDNQVNIGFSFPQYHYDPKNGKGFIGEKLRLFALSEDFLKQLDVQQWLSRYVDYVHISSIKNVPDDKVTGYAVYKRKQVKTNAERLARHRVKRGDIGFDEALARYRNVITTTDLPFIQMKSLTSDKMFKLFIEKQSDKKSETQVFSTYGLSSQSSVPEF